MDPDIAITINLATQAEIDEMNRIVGVTTYNDGSKSSAGNVVDGAVAIRFYGKLVAVLDEYGTATVLPGINQEQIERVGEAAVSVWPRRYIEYLKDPGKPDDPGTPLRVCYRCGYNEENHKALTARGKVSGPPYRDGCCSLFIPVPSYLRF